jgi:RNA polymerase sigma-70 factor, ECF subfamily
VLVRKEINEDEIIAALKAGGRNAMNVLYDDYSASLYGVILRIVESDAVAEDILQEVFVKIWQNIGSYNKEKGKIFTWLINIARNSAIDYIRSKSYRMNKQNQSIDNSVRFINQNYQVSWKIDHIGLREIVDKLRPDYRILVDKLYFEGYTQEEVSEELHIPLGTVKTRIRAAISRLREIMK